MILDQNLLYFSLPSMRATCPAHIIPLDLIFLPIFVVKYTLSTSSYVILMSLRPPFRFQNTVPSSQLLFLSSPHHHHHHHRLRPRRCRHESSVNRQNVKPNEHVPKVQNSCFVNVIALKVVQIVNRWQCVASTRCYVMKTETGK